MIDEGKKEETLPVTYTSEELIKDSVISSHNFFLNNITRKTPDSEENLAYKLKLKINDEYLDAIKNENIKANKYNDKLSFRTAQPLNELPKGEALDKDSLIPITKKPIEQPETKLLNKKYTREEKGFDNDLIPKITDTALVAAKDDIMKEKEKIMLNNIPEKYRINTEDNKNDNLVLSLYKNENHITFRKNKLVTPDWHAPWKLYRVISGHTGWVRCIDVDPTNNWFVTGSNDRVIKFWDLATGRLKLSLTGHINTVRSVVVSPNHPYLFSCGEDKQIKCWDLEQNKVVRHYHGHLSGVHCLSLHPSLDLLVSGGRDCVGRVWDMRSKQQVFCLEGHNNTVSSIVTQEFNPQIITGSHDATIKLWDINAGKCMTTLTHHKKSIRSLAVHHEEYTFISGGCDNLKVWKCPEGRFLRNLTGHNAIINAVALNKDGVVVSGADNGGLHFWDYKSGYNFQKIDSTIQPGSLSCEAGVYAIKFDHSSTRMITGECDKTIKMWKEDENATPEDFPINF